MNTVVESLHISPLNEVNCDCCIFFRYLFFDQIHTSFIYLPLTVRCVGFCIDTFLLNYTFLVEDADFMLSFFAFVELIVCP